MFLIHITYLPQDLHCDVKLFAKVIILMLLSDHIDHPASKSSNDLKIQERDYKWKIFFNPYKSRQAQDVTFNRKTKNIIHSNFFFNNLLIVTAASQKHLGLKLDTKLTFNDFINVSIFYFNFDIFNKSLMKPHLVYGDVIYVK